MAKEDKKLEFTHVLPANVLELNEGQLEGLPKNPRYIKDEKFAKLKLSLERSPEFLKIMPLKVYPMDNGHYLVCDGNMRFLAGREVGITEYPCYILRKETTLEKLKEVIIKSNLQYGSTDWDSLANDDWNVDDLDEWGLDVDFLKAEDDFDFKTEEDELSDKTYKEPEKTYMECPHCHHVDSATHFKKVAAPNVESEEDVESSDEIIEENNDENISLGS